MIKVYGSSDDLIEIEGDVEEEFPYPYDADDGVLLAVSDGTVLRVRYDDDCVWRVKLVREGRAHLNVIQSPVGDDEVYSDVALLMDASIDWVVLGSDIA